MPAHENPATPANKLSLRCPECQAELVIDGATGEVLFHQAAKLPPAAGKDFDALLLGLKHEKSRAEEIFERERLAVKDRDRLLDKKFEEAMKRAESEPDTGRPVRPFDLD